MAHHDVLYGAQARPRPPTGITPRAVFGQLLERYRIGADRTLADLARLVPCSPSYLSRLERADREPPSRRVVLRLARALHLTSVEADRLLLSAGYAPAWLVALARVATISSPVVAAERTA